jgi:hypothetical protein
MTSDYENPSKIAARVMNVDFYRTLSGRQEIPSDHAYWCLCNLQTTSPDSEINQLVTLGMLTKTQFVGVDRDSSLIEQNAIHHPDATWHCGDWHEVIAREPFNPACINLDLMSMADSPASCDIVYRTMKACPPDTVLLLNVALTNAHNGHETEITPLFENVTDKMTDAEMACWNLGDFPQFEYNGSGSTVMMTIGLYRGTA